MKSQSRVLVPVAVSYTHLDVYKRQVLDKALKLLHPFMPFITEELYQALPGSGESIMIQSWPTFDEAHNWAAEEEAFEKVMDYIKAVRTMRTEMNCLLYTSRCV